MSHQPTVLIVDDDVNILSAFGEFLKSEHCSVITAATADDALRILGSQSVQLVITDIRLKSTSGATLLIRIRQLSPGMPVIVITGYPSLISERDIRALGARYYFVKPLELDSLRTAVRECLRPSKSFRDSSRSALSHIHHSS